jgi:hypothetical protein
LEFALFVFVFGDFSTEGTEVFLAPSDLVIGEHNLLLYFRLELIESSAKRYRHWSAFIIWLDSEKVGCFLDPPGRPANYPLKDAKSLSERPNEIIKHKK